MRFGPFTLDRATRRLLRSGRPVHLSPKAFELLGLLVERRPAAIGKAEIHERLWPETFVTDGNVAVLVAEIRDALGDDARRPKYIRTVQRYGYAFEDGAPDSAPGSAREPAPCWIVWGTRRVMLGQGENVLGRSPTADVCVDAVGVSRRHAVIVVGANGVTLADLASKNGTFARGERVVAAVPLLDDTDIRLGPVPIRFCKAPAGASTQTWDAARSESAR